MKSNSILILKEIKPSMTSKEYVGWLNDKDLMRFTEVRFQKHTMQNVKKYVSEIYKSKTDFLYGAFVSQ